MSSARTTAANLWFHRRLIFAAIQRRTTRMASCGSKASCGGIARRLTDLQLRVTQDKATERPFTGEYNHHYEPGTYSCIVCSEPLFTSEAKFDSGSGWPSFTSSMGSSVARKTDTSHGIIRVEILCSKCDAHLGHVFDDGPQPTGERFCVNSASLNFTGKNN